MVLFSLPKVFSYPTKFSLNTQLLMDGPYFVSFCGFIVTKNHSKILISPFFFLEIKDNNII